MHRNVKQKSLVAVCLLLQIHCAIASAQNAPAAKIELGSTTARNGFKNEDEIRDKFNNWRTDVDSRAWLQAMDYRIADIVAVTASKPHGQKSDVTVAIRTKSGEHTERISIKLVSSPNGFNQIDKRWLSSYADMWQMPPEVVNALKFYVGETPPPTGSRDAQRMYLDELDEKTQQAVVEFFTTHKDQIISDLVAGDGEHAADWMMVTFKATNEPHWIIKPSAVAIRFYSDGPVAITKAGNLKLGRITMQRKGGDNGRESAKMLQFKLNPMLLFDAP
ncbi:MAG: hypothetical protein KDB01_27305 [Planctomycetaceae bacterium]|nr:hypothetical protein [Planctomycetaceae bacterium]